MAKNDLDEKKECKQCDSITRFSELDEEELNRLAAAELLKETEALSRIVAVEGALGWKTRRILKTNKIFLQQTLRHTINSNKRKKNVRSCK